MIGALLEAGLFATALVPAVWGGWWAFLALAALPRPGRRRAAHRPWQLVIVIPAHNEVAALPRCLASIQASTLAPAQVVVVADNCTDATAEVARALGVTVLERNDPDHRGKSYALDFALSWLGTQPQLPEAVVFIDADTEISSDCLAEIEACLADGARVVQAYYQATPGNSELARLRRLAFALVHWARPLGAARLGLGATLKGNGMAFRWDLVAAGTGGQGVTEDAAMTLHLVDRGVPVVFAPNATVLGLMAEDYRGARVQDERWEGGRAGLLLPALRAALRATRAGDLRCAAAALEVAAPPLSILGGLALLSLFGAALTGSRTLPLAAFAAGALTAYVLVGLAAAGVSRQDLAALRGLPRFVLHKLMVFGRLLRGGTPQSWQRTER